MTFASSAISLRDLRAGHLDAEELDVAAPAQLELEHELQLGERRHVGLEALDRGLDQLLGGWHAYRTRSAAPAARRVYQGIGARSL